MEEYYDNNQYRNSDYEEEEENNEDEYVDEQDFDKGENEGEFEKIYLQKMFK